MRSNEPKESMPDIDFSALDISDKQFDEMTEQTLRMVESMGLNKKSMMPCLLVHHRSIEENGMFSDMGVTVVGIDSEFSNTEEKRKLLRNLGMKFFVDKLVPCAVFMATEAWTSFKTKECIDDGMMPSQDPERKEVLMISGETISRDCKVGISIPVRRDEDNNMVRDGDNAVFRDKDISMFLLDMFFIGYFEPIVTLIPPVPPEKLEEAALRHKRKQGQ